jgi:hypothetical protein
MPKRTDQIHWNHIHWVVVWLTVGILLVLQGILQLDWIVVVLGSLPLVLLTPERDRAAEWSFRKKALAIIGTLALIGLICATVLLLGGDIELSGRVVVIIIGVVLVVAGGVLFLQPPL